MDNIKLNYLHICDTAFLSDNKKANIIGIFKTIYSSEFPLVFSKFAVVISLLITDLSKTKGEHKLQVKLVRKSDKMEIKDKTLNINFQIQEGQNEVNFIIDILNTKFDNPDKYELITSVDSVEINHADLEVIKT